MQSFATELEDQQFPKKEECNEAMPPCVWSVPFELLQIKRIAIKDLRKETIETEGRKPLRDATQLVGVSWYSLIPDNGGVFKVRSN
jgi:hypothetical protein